MKRISRHYLHKCLRIVADHCDHGEKIWCDESLQDFCNDRKNLAALKALHEIGNIKIFYAGDGPYAVEFKVHSYIYLLSRKERWLERLYGFVAGVAATVIAEIIIKMIIA